MHFSDTFSLKKQLPTWQDLIHRIQFEYDDPPLKPIIGLRFQP